MTCFISELMT